LVVLATLVFLIIILIVLHVIGGDLRVVNDLAACTPATLDDVALVNRVVEVVLSVILLFWIEKGSVLEQLMVAVVMMQLGIST
jgi:hypothetical protein